ncbi:hypothetical protein EPN42_09350 [bacterium]|nr:MAG: hypothetical protein EPN42_09350 [bacterium]
MAGGFDVGSHQTSSAAGLGASDVLGVSFLLTLERRTEKTALSIQQPVGYASGVRSLGQVQAVYRAGTYAFTYGALTGPTQSQIGIGGFARGLELRLPRRNGELDVLAASAPQQSGEGFRSLGIRRQYYLPHNTLLADTVLFSRGEQSGATNFIADGVLARYSPALSSTLELAMDRTGNIAGVSDGTRIATAAQFNAPLHRGFASLTMRSIPNGFTTLTSTNNAERSWDATLQRQVGHHGNALIDLGRDDAFSGGEWSRAIRRNLSYSQPLGASSLALTESYSRASVGDAVTVSRAQGVTATEQLKGFTLSQTLQRSSATSAAGTSLQAQESFSFGRALAGGYAELQDVVGRSEGTGASLDEREMLLSYTRRIGRRADLQLAQQLTSSVSAGAMTRLRSTSIGIVRRISSTVALNITATRSAQTGVNAGAASSLNVDLVGPLSFGGPRYAGRANPSLPATITGHVYVVSNAQSSNAATFGQRGVGNVLVLLDGGTPVRTDIDGNYEFRFVKQGYHSVSIVQGTVGNGLVADRGQVSLEVAGGQTATVDFGVGAFAGISGHLYAATPKGSQPVAGVEITVDGGRRTSTGPDGAYEIGGLLQGTHHIAVLLDSLPASVQLQGAPQRTVQVLQGQLATVDFIAIPLGSISGYVLYAPNGGFADLQGAKNVYVVAEPGDYAAITNEDGSFLLDNVPPGTYTVSVDRDTLPNGEAVVQGPESPIEVVGGSTSGGMVFKLGTAAKAVVFSFDNGPKASVSAVVRPERAPPGALVKVVVRTSAEHPSAVTQESDTFGNLALRFDTKLRAWVGSFIVPVLQAGEYALRINVDGSKHGVADSLLSVDPKIPLISVRVLTARPAPDHTIAVTARILAPVEPGDVVRFEDGYTFKLPEPRGVLYAFDVHLWSHGLPYRGTIENHEGRRFPIVLQRAGGM